MMTRLLRRHMRRETGATTAEYVGIVAFVCVLVLATIGIAAGTSEKAGGVISKAFCAIGAPFGFAGCSNEDLPGYVPTNCQLSSHESSAGGSVSIVATGGGDTGYTIIRIRERTDDGGTTDRYVVKTKGELSGSYEFGPKAGVEASAGGAGDANAEAGANLTIAGNLTTGDNYTFDSEEEAKDFAEKYKDQLGALGGDVEGAPEPDSTYYEVGAGAEIKGDLGPFAEGSGGGKATLGLETYKNGDKKVSVALTAEAALDLGIPLPERIIEASAKGDIELMVQADITFDKDGRVAEIGGVAQFTAEAEGGVDFAEQYEGKHAAEPKNGLKGLQMPSLPHLDAGINGNLNFSTKFRNDDGSYDYSGIDALSTQMTAYISGSGEMSPEQKAALETQINDRSQVTFTLSDHNKEENTYGLEGKLFFIKVGAEVHTVTVDQNVMAGYFYNPVAGNWTENLLCGE